MTKFHVNWQAWCTKRASAPFKVVRRTPGPHLLECLLGAILHTRLKNPFNSGAQRGLLALRHEVRCKATGRPARQGVHHPELDAGEERERAERRGRSKSKAGKHLDSFPWRRQPKGSTGRSGLQGDNRQAEHTLAGPSCQPVTRSITDNLTDTDNLIHLMQATFAQAQPAPIADVALCGAAGRRSFSEHPACLPWKVTGLLAGQAELSRLCCLARAWHCSPPGKSRHPPPKQSTCTAQVTQLRAPRDARGTHSALLTSGSPSSRIFINPSSSSSSSAMKEVKDERRR